MCKTGNRLYIQSESQVVPDVSSAHSDVIFDGKMTLFHRCSDNRNILFLPMKHKIYSNLLISNGAEISF